MELYKNLELVEVEYKEGGQAVLMTFYLPESGEIREVTFNKQSFDAESSKFKDDPEKAKQVDEWCEQYFSLPFGALDQAIGTRHDVYDCGKFNSLWPVDVVEKFDPKMKGKLYQTKIKAIMETDFAIRIRYEIDGKNYESKFSHGKYMTNLKKWMKNPQEKEKAYAKFEKKFHKPVSKKDELIGVDIMIEVKQFGKNLYGEIKELPE